MARELFSLTWADIDFEHGRIYIQNRDSSDRMPPFLVKDHDRRFVQLPNHTMELLAKYQSEVPEGVPYVLLTRERYERIVKKWREFRKAGKEWQNRYMVNNALRDYRAHAKRAGIRADENLQSTPSVKRAYRTGRTGCRPML